MGKEQIERGRERERFGRDLERDLAEGTHRERHIEKFRASKIETLRARVTF